MAAFFVLVEVLVVVVLRFAVGVVEFDARVFVDARGMRSFVTFTCASVSV